MYVQLVESLFFFIQMKLGKSHPKKCEKMRNLYNYFTVLNFINLTWLKLQRLFGIKFTKLMHNRKINKTKTNKKNAAIWYSILREANLITAVMSPSDCLPQAYVGNYLFKCMLKAPIYMRYQWSSRKGYEYILLSWKKFRHHLLFCIFRFSLLYYKCHLLTI